MIVLLALGCLSLGYVAGAGESGGDPTHTRALSTAPAPTVEPNMPAERPVEPAALQTDVLLAMLARQRAALLQLHAQLQHLADMAGLDDGEFQLALAQVATPVQAVDSGTNPTDLQRQSGLLLTEIDHINSQLDRMKPILGARRLQREFRLSGAPLAGSRVVSSRFGFRTTPFGDTRRFHEGVDFPGEPGEPILALAPGVVTFAGHNGAYGRLVEIEHSDGFRTRYAHNAQNLVRMGQRVRKGQAVATLGNSGRTTGAHLHLEVLHRGEPVDPMLFLSLPGG